MLYPLTAAIIFAWFFFFTWKSLSLYFDSDDMMNLYLAWSKPLAEVYRPVGALFYRGLFALGGFNPMPFRIACLAIGVANIGPAGGFCGSSPGQTEFRSHWHSCRSLSTPG